MESNEDVKEGRKVTLVGMWSNVALSILKILAGVFGRSSAMIADGIHSISDLLSDAVVYVVIGASRKKEDDDHSYGHGKIETLASLAISLLLAGVAVGIFIDGLDRVIDSVNGTVIPRPGFLALIMGVVSIGVKEWLFHYTRRAGIRISSEAMIANAWHHRSDAFSSFATLAGVAGAMFLGEKWRILDPLAAMVVSVLIMVMAWKLSSGAVRELLEESLPSDITGKMKDIISSTPGVKSFHHFRSRKNGSLMIVDVHVKADPDISLASAHDIASNVEHRLKAAFGRVLANVHMEPYYPHRVS